jgi:type II secretory pathway component PulF
VSADGTLLFAFDALRTDGVTEHGTVTAGSDAEARACLAQRGLLPIRVAIEETRLERRAALPSADLALGLRILSDLLQSGLPVLRALQTFGELAPPAWRKAIPQIQESVKAGKGLTTALADAPVDIPPLVIGIIRAGEAGSGLADAVRRAADISEHSAATRAAVRGALAYPAVVAVAGVGSIGIMVGVVLPRFAVILADLGQTLPASTRFVLGASLAARAAFIPIIAGVIVLSIALRAWMNAGNGRVYVHRVLLRVPLVGTIRFASATANATGSLGALLESGVPVRTALAFAAKSTGDAEVERRLAAATARVITGQSIGASFLEFSAVTVTAVRLIRAGEETGRLAGMLAHAGRLEQERAERITRAAVRMLEPMLILGFAGLVGLVAAALLQAVYSVRPG